MAKNIELYNKTVGILYQAYFNDTLEHGNCQACAVGNIVAANMGFKFIHHMGYKTKISWELPLKNEDPMWTYGNTYAKNGWPTAFITLGNIQEIGIPNEAGKIQINSTGYCEQDLAKIEYAFETALRGKSDEDYMFNGLVAVLNVLNMIHEIDSETITTTHKRFEAVRQAQ